VVDPLDPARVGRALLEVIADPPSPQACRAAAVPHGLGRQAGRVAEILERAAGRT
jgi:hypothetical protein